jgi:hypothetical protein
LHVVTGIVSFLTLRPAIPFGVAAILAVAASCSSSNTINERTHFSRTDSLTDIYLVLQDTLLQSWNRVIRFEMDRQEALSVMIDRLQNTTVIDGAQTEAYYASLNQIERIRFTQKSMTDPHVIEEYDKACEELLRQLTSAPEASAQLEATLGALETLTYYNARQRKYYDSVATEFNSFIKVNWSDLQELDSRIPLEQKPLFWTVNNR